MGPPGDHDVYGKPRVIALEEHYYDPDLAATFDSSEGRTPEIRRRLDDLGELRLGKWTRWASMSR